MYIRLSSCVMVGSFTWSVWGVGRHHVEPLLSVPPFDLRLSYRSRNLNYCGWLWDRRITKELSPRPILFWVLFVLVGRQSVSVACRKMVCLRVRVSWYNFFVVFCKVQLLVCYYSSQMGSKMGRKCPHLRFSLDSGWILVFRNEQAIILLARRTLAAPREWSQRNQHHPRTTAV